MRSRRTLSVGLAALIVAVVLRVLWSVAGGFVERAREISDLRDRVFTAEKRAAVPLEALRRIEADLNAELAARSGAAADAEPAAAHLQESFRGAASGAIHLDSVRSLSPVSEGGFGAVRASASLRLPPEDIYDLVARFEAAEPPLIVDSLRAGPRHAAGAHRDGPALWDLTITARVRHPQPEAGRAGGDPHR